jgi:hypothetical protein
MLENYRSRLDAPASSNSFGLSPPTSFPIAQSPELTLSAEHIFGPDVGSLKGKTVWCRPHLAKPTIEPLPPEVMSQYHNVTLAVDVMLVNGIPMLVTISRNIRFSTVEALPNSNIPMLVKGIKAIATM